MAVEKELQKSIDWISKGEANKFAPEIGQNFGIYIPMYEDNGVMKRIPDGYTQIESDLSITITKKTGDAAIDGKPVAWLGNPFAADSKCTHPGGSTCKHCTGHGGPIRTCTSHKSIGPDMGLIKPTDQLAAPRLDYDKVSAEIREHKNVLEALGPAGMGLTLLHAHSDEHEFTELPVGMVSVISGNTTYFRPLSDVQSDKTFVPNVWRAIDGQLQIAGGYSKL